MNIHELDVRHAYATVNGIRMHYVEQGEGPLVVLLHGFPETWWSWRYQIEPLARAGFRVVAPDLRGYNDTEVRGPYDLDTLANDVAGLIAALGEKRARIVGHDWGGALAWHFAATIPERCERLVVLNCPHPAQLRRALMTKPSQLRRSWYMFFFLLPRVPEYLLTRDNAAWLRKVYRGMAKDRSHFEDPEIAPFREAIQKPGVASAMLAYYRTSLSSALSTHSPFSRMRTITAPTLLLWALDDEALGFDDLVPGTEKFVPALRIETIPNCGHFVQAERPDVVNERLVAFLREPTATVSEPAARA